MIKTEEITAPSDSTPFKSLPAVENDDSCSTDDETFSESDFVMCLQEVFPTSVATPNAVESTEFDDFIDLDFFTVLDDICDY